MTELDNNKKKMSERVNSFEEMLGQTINKIWLNEDHDKVVFETTGGDFAYVTVPDCCNQVWFEHLSLSPKLFGSYLMGVEAKDWVDISNEPDSYEVLEQSFWTLTTSNGYIDLEVRNSHNGYYGGSIDYVANADWKRYSIVKEDMREITEDF